MPLFQLIIQTLFGEKGKGTSGNASHVVHESSREPKGNKLTRVLLSLGFTLVFGAIYFYFRLPALNFHSGDLYWFLFWLCLVYTISMIILRGKLVDVSHGYFAYARKQLTIPFYLGLAICAVAIVGTLMGLTLFRAKDYSNLISVQTGDFTQDVAEISFDQIPMLDSESANLLANRKLGELSDLVSQFTVSTFSAQINYQGKPVRVTYLDYENAFKWLSNRKQGLPAYMVVNMLTQDVSVVRLEDGIRYSPSEYFGRDLTRHLRMSYPTLIFDDVNFEIDEDGTPYWVASVLTKTIGLFQGRDVIGAVLMDATTGECTYYDIEDVPTWVDRVYSSELILEQYDYHGKFQGGFWNSLFGQKDCTASTDGYNYIAMNDDVWLYTGITSISEDRGNIGFILVNQRTKESKYYSCAGAEEYSAMSSAEGAVQQYSYSATFPLLLNISDEPTYFMALKDAAGLVKMYAMVNVQQYQIVATGSSVADCRNNYHELLIANQVVTPEEIEEAPVPEPVTLQEVQGVIEEIRQAGIDGNTFYFIRLEGETKYYSISAKDEIAAVLLNPGDQVSIQFDPASVEESITPAAKIERR